MPYTFYGLRLPCQHILIGIDYRETYQWSRKTKLYDLEFDLYVKMYTIEMIWFIFINLKIAQIIYFKKETTKSMIKY